MRKQKRLLATALAASMVFSLGTTAFAEENSNTVTGTGNPATADETTENKASIAVNGQYLSELESDTIISVNVAWTDMNFQYAASRQGTWDPTDHTYTDASAEGKWLKDSATITVTNHSNEEITANLSYQQTDGNVTGTFDETELSLANAAEGTSLNDPDKAPSKTVGFKVGGMMTKNAESSSLGTITVGIGTADNTAEDSVLDLSGVDTSEYSAKIQEFVEKNNVTKLSMKLGTTSISYDQGEAIKTGCKSASVTEIVVLDVVETSGDSIFENWSEVTSISMPCLTEMGMYTFYACTSLKKIDLPELKQTTDFYPIYNCSALEEISFPKLETIVKRLVLKCENITTINLPELTTVDGTFTFGGCKALTTVNLPKLTNTVEGMFYQCSSLEKVILPEARNCAEETFNVCTNLKSASFPKATSIGARAFWRCDELESLSFGTVLSSVDTNAFQLLTSPENVTLTLNKAQNGVTWGEGSTFAGYTFKDIVGAE